MSESSNFLCHTSMTKGNREQEHSRTFNTTVHKRADSCPLTATDFTAHGVRGVACSVKAYTPAFWALDGQINSAPEKASCTSRTPGNYWSA